MNSKARTCIIGAGSSGIATAKVFHEQGLRFDCYEKSDRIGGNWVFGNRNGMSACYEELCINTSKGRMAYSDFPMPASYPDFPLHHQIAAYFEDYVDHFGFRSHIHFETGVEHVSRVNDGWAVQLSTGNTRLYDAVVVANGHHWDPRWPEPAFPGEFHGEQIHAHSYQQKKLFRDKRVVIVGMGNSAMDISVESSYVAEQTYLSARSGAWIIPKYLFGRPLDTLAPPTWVPMSVRRVVYATMLNAMVGTPMDYGLPKPKHRLLESHPTISGRILDRIVHGAIEVKPNIDHLDGDAVVFTDGSRVKADLIVYCTGYKVTFPFFDETLLSAPNNDLPLYMRVFHPDWRSLFFVGLLQPLGAVMPLAEAQSEWIADFMTGRYSLPETEAMRNVMDGERDRMFRRYVASPRHTMQVDFDDYLEALQHERRIGGVRASRKGFVPPIRAGASRKSA